MRIISKKRNRIIYLTTNSGYGVGEKNKFCDENSPLRPISLYGRTKCDAENEVVKSNNFICFRLATVFGFSYRMRTDLLVNNFVHKSVRTKKLTIFEPHFRRNFIHIRDVVSGIVYAINNFHKLKSNIYNLGLSSATGPPSFEATVSSLIRREKILPFFASCLPFLCFIFAHFECPAIISHPYLQLSVIHLIVPTKFLLGH